MSIDTIVGRRRAGGRVRLIMAPRSPRVRDRDLIQRREGQGGVELEVRDRRRSEPRGLSIAQRYPGRDSFHQVLVDLRPARELGGAGQRRASVDLRAETWY